MDEAEQPQAPGPSATANPAENVAAEAANSRKRAAGDIEPEDSTQTKTQKTADVPEVEPIQCSICLKHITTETIGKPENCQHDFCLACLLQWSKTNNTCPIDRSPYQNISFTNKSHGDIEGLINVAVNNNVRAPAVAPRPPRVRNFICSVCQRGDMPNNLVRQCSACRWQFHLACSGNDIDANVALEDWCCQGCIQALSIWLTEPVVVDADVLDQDAVGQRGDAAENEENDEENRGEREQNGGERDEVATGEVRDESADNEETARSDATGNDPASAAAAQGNAVAGRGGIFSFFTRFLN